MQNDKGRPPRIRFGVFEVDLQAGEVRRQGLKIKLQEQPIQVLAMLLEQPGQVVLREDLQKQLWPADTFVDFERGLNRAINKLRDASPTMRIRSFHRNPASPGLPVYRAR